MREEKIHDAVHLWRRIYRSRKPAPLGYDLNKRLGQMFLIMTPDERKETTKRITSMQRTPYDEAALTLATYTKKYVGEFGQLADAIRIVEEHNDSM